MVRGEMTESVKDAADQQVEERLLDYLLPRPEISSGEEEDGVAKKNRTARNCASIAKRFARRSPGRDRRRRKIHRHRRIRPGRHGNDVEFQSMVEKCSPASAKRGEWPSKRPQGALAQEAEKLVDREKIHRTAIERVEQAGIVFLDELDKIAGTDSKHGRTSAARGAAHLLPIVEGSASRRAMASCAPTYSLHRRRRISFRQAQRSDAGIAGAISIRVELQDLTKDDFVRILHEPQNSLIKQQVALMGTEGVEVDSARMRLIAMAQIAYDLNRRTQNIGARRLYTILERVVEKISFDGADSREKDDQNQRRLRQRSIEGRTRDEDLSKSSCRVLQHTATRRTHEESSIRKDWTSGIATRLRRRPIGYLNTSARKFDEF